MLEEISIPAGGEVGGGGEGGGIDGAQATAHNNNNAATTTTTTTSIVGVNNGSDDGSGGGGSNIGIHYDEGRVAQLEEELQAMNDDNERLRRTIEMMEATIQKLLAEGEQPQDPPNDNDYGNGDLYDDNDNYESIERIMELEEGTVRFEDWVNQAVRTSN